jgi:hypothetical protein
MTFEETLAGHLTAEPGDTLKLATRRPFSCPDSRQGHDFYL